MGVSIASNIDGVVLTPLKIIDTQGGNVLHAMKQSDPGYAGFGEAYFSTVEAGVVKGWKRHHQMTLNLVVPIGAVRFVGYDDRSESNSFGLFQKVVLAKEKYYRLTVPPMLWVGFQGIADMTSTLLNIADIEHRPDEVDKKMLNELNFDWDKD